MTSWPGKLMRRVRGDRSLWRARLGTLGMVLAVFLTTHLWQTRHVPSGPAPEFSALAVSARDGAVLSLAQWRAAHPGRPVALHFWAEWCPICKVEEHSVSRVSRDWPVLTVAMQSGDVAAVRRVLARRSLSWATVIDPDGTLAARYGFRAVPAFVVIGGDGRIRATSVGYTSEIGMRLRLWWAMW
ncbi:MAG: protein disulfide oxidoreductase [Pseudomonadota bacterium]|nr:protein disulfide oxidoreductase [Pseudomonadota bacterium]